ncbi:hypothetical protein GIB67_013843 [Kingdonia uniflora]|uniref:Homeobox domain-containing protein n=1 Tax=Kingdonia uniflora TaxID=39325 RepID=A0A7J7N3T6_9MAGN|nr:hypothetical protein GIB67_013843 [Kingdonia uniflora]
MKVVVEQGEEACKTALDLCLGLSLGQGQYVTKLDQNQKRKRDVQFHVLFPSPKKEIGNYIGTSSTKPIYENREEKNVNAIRKGYGNSSSNNEDDSDVNGMRKKLRLTKEQSTILEDCFDEHNTLNSVQKQELADRLGLRPRQIEVWFQNRRARTKLKQTEVNFEYLKKWCETLSNENQKLKKELQELKSVNLGTSSSSSSFYVQFSKKMTMAKCASCNKVEKIREETDMGGLGVVEKPMKLCSEPDDSSLTS